MAQQVGDLWPFASGTSSLGAEMRNGGFTGAIRPFATVHMNSGVFHDTHGPSGVMRYSDDPAQFLNRRFEFSLDGGITFPITIGESAGNSIGINSNSLTESLIITSLFDIGIAADGNASLAASTGDATVQGGVNINLLAGKNATLAATQNIALNTQYNNIEVNSAQQISLFPFAGSGALDYRFGPYQSWYILTSHSATGGPFNDGYWPIPHSGNVVQMIQTAVDGIDISAGITSLDGAYSNGNTITLTMFAPDADVASANYKSQPKSPVVIKHSRPGAGINTGHDKTLAFKDASIVASGYTLTPNVRRSFAWSAIGPGYIAIQGSGSPSSDGGHMILESALGKNTAMTVSGLFAFSSTDSLIFNVQDDGTANAPGISFLTTNTGRGTGGQIAFSPFGGSGALEYRFGPYQAWYTKNSHSSLGGPFNDGYWPLANSGEVAQMITQGTSLQKAYNNGVNIVTEAIKGGAVSLSGVGAYCLFLCVNEQDHAHIRFSGVAALPVNGVRRGSFWLQGHTAGQSGQLIGSTAPVDYATGSARSLGIDTFFYLTGSGITNVRTSSGVAQFFNVTSTDPITEIGIVIPINSNTTADQHFGVNITSGITTFVSGKYKISYVVVLEKTAGNLAQMVSVELRLRDKWGQAWKLLGSDSAAIIRDSNKLNLNTANGQWMGDIRAGETLQLFATTSEAPYADNSVRGFSRRCNVIVEWMGPMSAGGSTRSAI